MTLIQFCNTCNFTEKTEIERVRLILFYFYKSEEDDCKSLNELCESLVKLGYQKPNLSRLKQNLIKSRSFLKGHKDGFFKLSPKDILLLESLYPNLNTKSEEITSDETILPESLYNNTRGYIEIISKQINACFHYNIFDGCAVLMRRLMEILLIIGYENKGRISEIEDGKSGLKNLNAIINYTLSNKVLKISKETEEVLDDFRQIGNFAAHKIQYNTKRGDIDKVRLKYRLTIEELLYESGIKK